MSDLGRMLAAYYARRLAWLVLGVGVVCAGLGAAIYHYFARFAHG